MKLSIQNIAKIKQADIQLDGITVIAGANNTGKSTVGKALYGMFVGFSGLETRVLQSRHAGILANAVPIISSYEEFPRKGKTILGGGMSTTEFQQLRNAFFDQDATDADKVLGFLAKYVQRYFKFDLSGNAMLYAMLEKAVRQVTGLKDSQIAMQAVESVFRKIFVQQINSAYTDDVATIEMNIQQKYVKTVFAADACSSLVQDIALSSHAIYIDNPFAVDFLFKQNVDDNTMMDLELQRCLAFEQKENLVVDTVTKVSLQEVYRLFDCAIPGQLKLQEGHQIVFTNAKLKKPIHVENLSTGIKAFAILKLLLQNRQLKERDVLILDEPEIHLHPEWQLIYAELLVLLQKQLNLTLLLTTHSPYFLNAIEVFTKKHGTEDTVKYYRARSTDGVGAILEDVTGHVDTVYAELAKPFDVLESLEEHMGMMEE